MQNIVVGYDGSEPAKRALERAAELANGATITVVTAVKRPTQAGRGPAVADPDDVPARGHALAEAKTLLHGKGIEPRAIEGHGDPADVIVEEAKELPADLIVVGTRGQNVAERLLLGSVSTKVLHHAPCNVLVVR